MGVAVDWAPKLLQPCREQRFGTDKQADGHSLTGSEGSGGAGLKSAVGSWWQTDATTCRS